MTHNLTVTIEEELWKNMKSHPEIRWSQVMKQAAQEKLQALNILTKAAKKGKLNENEIKRLAIQLGKKVTNRR